MEGDVAAFASDLSRGTFTLLSERRELGRPVDWSGGSGANGERLWPFHLHYHEYLLDVVAAGTDRGWEIVSGLLADWLTAHPSGGADPRSNAWHPFCISRRLPIWLQLVATGKLEPTLSEQLLASAAAQAELLCRNQESDLGGNHLLENARGLALAGSALDAEVGGDPRRPQAWLAAAEHLLRCELPRQILPHGEHFERSPMYHCQVLGNLLQIAQVAALRRPSLAALCGNWARPMWAFLQSILHPDGEIPLLGDSCFGEAYPVEELRRLVDATGVEGDREADSSGVSPVVARDRSETRPMACSPYWVWREGDDAWIVDGGAAAADWLPAHGHCDLGTFEASIGGRRWLVDSGLFGYGDDSMRRYCRSSVAHNVVTVDDRNQFDVWSRFRMGYRVAPSHVETGEQKEVRWMRIGHRAYRGLGVAVVERITAADPRGIWACIDFARGGHGTRLVGHLHLAPEVQAKQVARSTWELCASGRQRVLHFSGVEASSLAKGWYAPRFGCRTAAHVIQYSACSDGDACIGWTLSAGTANRPAEIEFGSQDGHAVATLRDWDGNPAGAWKLTSGP
jgi:uncharacterized heparinase superfamily protein